MMAIRKDKDKKKKKEKDKKALLHLVTLVHFDLPNYCLCVMYCFLVFLLLGCVCVLCMFLPSNRFWWCFGVDLLFPCFPICFPLLGLSCDLMAPMLPCMAACLVVFLFRLVYLVWFAAHKHCALEIFGAQKKLLSGEAERQELGRNQSSRRTEKQATKR